MSRTKGATNKPKVTTPKISSDKINESEEIDIVAESKPKKNTFTCERCGSESIYNLIVIDTSRLTQIASYHRESPQQFKLCRECCKELSDVVDRWYLQKGKGKFQI